MTTESVHTLYKFEELSDRAKEKAREWWRKSSQGDEWWDFEDTITCAKLIGIEINKRDRGHCIFFSGFSSQGDGACFEGRYSYVKGAAKAIREHAPVDKVLHSIADSLQDIQRRHFYRLEARVVHSGHYSHEYCTDIDVTDSETGDSVDADTAEAITTELRNFMRWIYRQLEDEYNGLMSDESVDENITINEYTFDEDGNRDN